MSDATHAPPALEFAVSSRYEALAGSACCLSCGGAADLAEPQPGEVCVDLGSGRGEEALRLADTVGPAGFVYGIDITPAMIEKARRTAAKLGVRNVAFLQADLADLPLEEAAADLVVSNCVLNHAADKKAVWREIHRVLKPGGRFVISDIFAIEEVPEVYRTDPAAVAECWAGAVTRAEYFDAVTAAGFAEVRVLEESSPYDKGRIRVASLTLSGLKPAACRGC